MEHDENNLVELIGEDGTPVSFEHLMTIEHKEALYVLLTPAEPETKDEEGAVVIMRIEPEADGEDRYIVEEDEAVLEEVFDKFLEFLDQEGEDDEEE